MARRAAQVRPSQGAVFEVKADQFLQISDMAGKQVATFVAWNRHDFTEYLSTAETREANNALMLRKDDGIYSNRHNRMFTLLEDTVGRHDMLYPVCNTQRYLDDYGIPDHANCHDNILKAMDARGHELPDDRLPDAINFFMYVAVKGRGEFEIREPLSGRNDNVILRAHMDTIVAISACPNDQSPMTAFKPTDILVRVYA